MVAGLLDRVVDAEAGVAEVLRDAAREVVLAVVELVRVEVEVADALRVDDVDPDGAVVEEPGMEELHLEASSCRATSTTRA